jgi:Fur family transcriptional regulator, peroxide stress response regulator
MNAIKILTEKNIKVTSQRVKLLNYLIKENKHYTAENIYNNLKSDNEVFSFATVYNTLLMLERNDILIKINAPSGVAYYDLSTNEHLHFYCKNCEKIIDIECKNWDNLELNFHGNKPKNFYGFFVGYCCDCC